MEIPLPSSLYFAQIREKKTFVYFCFELSCFTALALNYFCQEKHFVNPLTPCLQSLLLMEHYTSVDIILFYNYYFSCSPLTMPRCPRA